MAKSKKPRRHPAKEARIAKLVHDMDRKALDKVFPYPSLPKKKEKS